MKDQQGNAQGEVRGWIESSLRRSSFRSRLNALPSSRRQESYDAWKLSIVRRRTFHPRLIADGDFHRCAVMMVTQLSSVTSKRTKDNFISSNDLFSSFPNNRVSWLILTSLPSPSHGQSSLLPSCTASTLILINNAMQSRRRPPLSPNIRPISPSKIRRRSRDDRLLLPQQRRINSDRTIPRDEED